MTFILDAAAKWQGPILMPNEITRPHVWKTSKVFMPKNFCDECAESSGKKSKLQILKSRIAAYNSVHHCENCQITVCNDCKRKFPSDCIFKSVAVRKGKRGYLVDFCPKNFRPSIPHILVHLCCEIERRCLTESDLYLGQPNSGSANVGLANIGLANARLPNIGLANVGLPNIGSGNVGLANFRSEAEALVQSILYGRGQPQLRTVEPQILCESVKVFLGDLLEPVIPGSYFCDFKRSITNSNAKKKSAKRRKNLLIQVGSGLTESIRHPLNHFRILLERFRRSLKCFGSILGAWVPIRMFLDPIRGFTPIELHIRFQDLSLG